MRRVLAGFLYVAACAWGSPGMAAEEMIVIPAGAFTMGRDDGPDDERPSHSVTLPAFRIDRLPVDHLPFGVAGIGGHAEQDLGAVFLDRIQAELGELGGLAEQQRQQAGGKRIERAGVPRLFRLQQALHRLQYGTRTRADRLVEQQHAV